MMLSIMNKLFVLVFLILFFSSGLFAQTIFNRLKVEHWDTKRGLPHDLVLSTYQTRDGFLWIISHAGLSRFDGIDFYTFNSKNQPLMKTDAIHSMVETPDDALWISTPGSGLLVYKKGKFEQYLEGYSLGKMIVFQDNPLLAVFSDTSDKIFLFNTESKEYKETDSSSLLNFLTDKSLFIPNQTDRDGNKWIRISSDKILRISQTGIYTLSAKDGIQKDLLYANPYIDRKNRIWIPSNKGLWFWNGKKLELFPGTGDKDFYLLRNAGTLFLEDRKGGIWMGFEGGLGYLPPGASNLIISPKNFLSDISVFRHIIEDRESNLWLSSQQGLFKLSNGKFINFFDEQGNPQAQPSSAVCEVSKGRYLVAIDQNLYWINNHVVSPFKFKNPKLKDYRDEIVHIFQDSKGNIWICGFLNLIRVSKEGEKIFPREFNARYGFEDNQKKMWFTIPYKGIAFLNEKDEMEMLELPGIDFKNWYISSINQLYDGRWLLTSHNKGILFIDPKKGSKEYFDEQNGLNTNNIFGFHQEKDGVIWFFSIKGLSRYKNNKFDHIGLEDGLPDNNLFGFLPDQSGNIWLSSNSGIIKVARKELDSYLNRRIDKINWHLYDSGDGMRKSQCQGARFSKVTSDGKILIPTFGGLVEIIPSNLPNNTIPSPVVIHRVHWDDQIMDLTLPLDFSPGNHRIIFDYSGLSLNSPEKVKFKFRIVGYDEDWIIPDGDRRAIYTNLPSGTYTFQVIACNNDGVWNEKGASITFTIQPFVYETWWFRGLSFIVFVGLILVLIRWRTYSIRKRNKELETQVEKRTIELKEAYKDLKIASEVVEEKSEILEEQNNEIKDSINYAQRIQMAMLPKLDNIHSHIPNLFILFKPRDVVSGDFYYFAHKEDILILAAVDCTGHGVPGAFMSLIGNDILNNLVEMRGIVDTGQILTELHKGVRQVLRQKETRNNDGMDIALLAINYKDGFVEFSGARNPLVYIQKNQLFLIKGNNFPIGGEQRELERVFGKHIIPFRDEKGQTIKTSFYIFSDGYKDQIGGPNNKKFMIKNFRELLLEIHQMPKDEQQKVLEQRLNDWMLQGGEEQIDDILLVGFNIP